MAEEDGRPVAADGPATEPFLQADTHHDKAAPPDEQLAMGPVLQQLSAKGLARNVKGHVELTSTGRREATELVRRHRLTETLLTQVLNLEIDDEDDEVCRLEHAISPRMADTICAFLGHPPVCPHGRPIPSGPCCENRGNGLHPLVAPLCDAEPGEHYRIAFITPARPGRMDRLAVLGIIPGADIYLRQRNPVFVLQVGETEVALDTEIAREIHVRPN